MAAAIEEIAARFPTYGSRRIAVMLRRGSTHLLINRKRVRRIMREHGLVCRRKRAMKRTTNSHHPFARFESLVMGLVPERPDQVWVCDITYIKLGNGEFVYLAIVMDVFTRSIRGWSLSRGLGVDLSLAALQQAFLRGVPEIHQTGSRRAIRLSRIRRRVAVETSAGQPGRSGAGSTERLCRKSDSHDQGRRSVLERVPSLRRSCGAGAATSLKPSITASASIRVSAT